MKEGGRSTKELLDAADGLLAKLREGTAGRMEDGLRPVNRDATMRLLTDTFVLFDALGKRLAGLTYSEAPVKSDDEEDAPERADAAALADLFAEPDAATTSRIDFLQRGLCDRCADIAGELQGEIHDLRVRDFTVALELFVGGARTPEEVTRRVLAVIRRVRPELLQEHFGLSQADVSRRLGETRATTSAREKRVIEAPLKKAGARGFKLAGGARGEEHRKRCAQAQKGNTNRADGELRKRSRA